MPRPIRVTTLQRGDRAVLEQWGRARTTPRRVLERARIVLASADGRAGEAICALLGVSRPTVSRWLDRYDAERAIRHYIVRRNADPTPFTWTASVRCLLAKVKTANATLTSLH